MTNWSEFIRGVVQRQPPGSNGWHPADWHIVVNRSVCLGCGACVAACPNAAAMLFLGAKITHLGELPQGQPERAMRVQAMVAQHDQEGFGGCTNIGECSAACPKGIPMDVISQLNHDLRRAGSGKF